MVANMAVIRRYGFDPGDVTGIAICDLEGKLVDYGQITADDLMSSLLKITHADVFIIEEFRIRPGVNFSWNDMWTIQAIGMIKFRAFQIGARVKVQSPSIKAIGYKWAGIKTSKDHSFSHQLDAWAHLTYYNHKELGLPIPALRVMEGEK
jgi:hypothetical protein